MNARARWTSLAGAGVVALVALSGVSCKKGDVAEPTSPITVSEFKATAEGHAGDGKTGLTGRDVYWTDGDDAKVFSNSNIDGVRYVADGGFGTNTTDFILAGGTAVSGSEFYAVYPYGAAGSFSSGDKKVNVTIPGVQTYNEAGGFANGANVMAAYTNSSNLAFEYQNVCGVLRLKLTGSATVRTVTVRAKNGEKLCGTGTITFDGDGKPSLSIGSDGGSAVCLTCPNGVRLTGEGVEFNLVVAPCTMASGFDVTVVCDEGTFVTSSNHNNPIDAGKILGMPPVHVTAVSHDEDGALPGVFSVSATKKVRFSKGNLYYDENTGKWRFEDSQYDFRTYYGNTNASTKGQDACIGGAIGSTPAGQWGLFGWSAKKADGITPYVSGNAYGMLTSENYSDYGSATNDKLMDWGENPIANGGANNTWRTLTGDSNGEWKWLLGGSNAEPDINCRTTSYTSSDGTTNCRYAAVRVNGVCGLLLFPDVFSWPEGGGNEPTVFNTNSSTWNNGMDYTVEQFAVLEQNGCVFLPCAGCRFRSEVVVGNFEGFYWSSTASISNSFYAYNLDFYPTDVLINYQHSRHYGRSVRLVHPL